MGSTSDTDIHTLHQTLEAHQHHLRIKKLLLYACRRRWENDPVQLNAVSLQDLIREARSTFTTLEALRTRLYVVVSNLSKQAEYKLIADLILNQVSCLYTQQPSIAPPLSSPTPTSPDLTQHTSRKSYDPFEVRLAIMQHTNPLRAKILILSALHRPFNFGPQDWSILRTQTLHLLLVRLCAACGNIDVLQKRLLRVARLLPDPDEYVQAAGAIVQALHADCS